MKRFLSILLVFCVLMSTVYTVAFATEFVDVDDICLEEETSVWSYDIISDQAEEYAILTGYSGSDSDVFIPARIDGIEVKKLGDGVFENNADINSATFGEGICEIGDSAFKNAESLVCVVTPESLEIIGNNAFEGDVSFNSIVLYDNVSEIGEDAFNDCDQLTVYCNENTVSYDYVTANNINYEILNPEATPEIVTVDGVEYYIGNGVATLMSCTDNISEDVTIPSNVNGYPVTMINDYAFKDVRANVYVPNSVLVIGENAFENTFGYLTLPESITKIKKDAFIKSRVIGVYFKSLASWCNIDFENMYASPASVNGVDLYCNGVYIVDLVIPGNIKEIKPYAFSMYKELKSVTLENGVEKVGAVAFQCCEFETLKIPNTLKEIGDDAFWGLYQLDNVYLEDVASWCNVDIESGSKEGPLKHAKNLYVDGVLTRDLVIPDGVETVKRYTFQDFSGLRSITLGDSVTNVEGFWQNINLEYVNVKDLSAWFKVKDGYRMMQYSTDDNVRHNVDLYFDGEPIENLTIPGSIKTIPDDAFNYCKNIKNVVIEEGVEEIGSYSFNNMPSLVSLTLPQSLVRGGGSGGSGQLKGNNEYFRVYCYRGSWGESFAKLFGATYFLMDSDDVIIEENGVKYKLAAEKLSIIGCDTEKEGVLTIPETVNGYPVTGIGEYAFWGCEKLTNIILPESIIKIGGRAFCKCKGLTEFIMPDSVCGTLGGGAFEGCIKLESVKLSNNLTDSLVSTFQNCISLEEITIPDGIDYISGTFRGCTGLKKVVLTDNITTIYDYTFNGCSKLSDITIPQKLNQLGDYAFENCKSIKSIDLPDTLTKFGYAVFHGCTGLESVSLGNNLTEIGNLAFYECASLKDIVIPESVKEIKQWAFSGCSSIKSISIPNSVEKIVGGAFSGCTALESAEILNENVSGDSFFSDCTSLKEINIPAKVFENSTRMLSNTGFIEITLPEGITKVKLGMLSSCKNLEKVIIPNTVKVICSNSFASCPKLTDVVIPESVEVIENAAFMGCKSLGKINIPSSVKTVEGAAIAGTAVNGIFIDDLNAWCNIDFVGTVSYKDPSLLYVAHNLYLNGELVKNLVIPDGVTKIKDYAFDGGTCFESIVLPKVLTEIGNCAFRGCSNVATIVIPESVTSIGTDAFEKFSGILCVYEGSCAIDYAIENDIPYFVIHKTANPEISYGTGISGTVSDKNGNVIPNATVSIIDDSGEIRETVTTNENGDYAFTYSEVGKYTVKAMNSSGNVGTEEVSVKRKNVFQVYLSGKTDIVINTAYSISGTVSDSNAKVTLTDKMGKVIAETEASGGVFSFEDIPNGTYIIKAESDTGSAVQEVQVFNNDISGIALDIVQENSEITGIITDKDGNPRVWANVTVYGTDGVAVANVKTDENGSYTIGGLKNDDYSIVVESNQMIEKDGYQRSTVLKGYGFIEIAEKGKYQVDTIKVYAEKDGNTTLQGKVTAQGEKNISEIIITDAFQNEVARATTANSGKYKFVNLKDGLYFITALTESYGMGLSVITIHNGAVSGSTEIKIHKSDKVKAHEDLMSQYIVNCTDRGKTLAMKDKILEEKAFYDSLLNREKQEFSKDYLENLNKLIEWISQTEYKSNDANVVISGGGLLSNADEITNNDTIQIEVTVNETEGVTIGQDGVQTDEEYVQQMIEDNAGDKTLGQYYNISLRKGTNEVYKNIESIVKDADATGKLRITMPIPEELKGHENYSFVHVHNGETVALTDLDDNPDTVTFEVSEFSLFVLCYSDEPLTEDPEDDTPSRILGDINGDGFVDDIDWTIIFSHVSYITEDPNLPVW